MFWTNIAINTLLFFYVIVSLFMCLVVLMQRSKQEGLGAAFGGGITESMWGAQTSQVLVKATVWLAILFFALSIALARLYTHREALSGHTSTLDQELLKSLPAKSATVTPAASTPAVTTPTATNPAVTTPAATTPAATTPANNAAPAQPVTVAPAASTSTAPAPTAPASNAAPATPAAPAAK
jgi:preprotein translocase subunit SecG